MLSCKRCGAQMSGTDLICKNCGTPWGKKHKSRTRIYLSIFFILLTASAAYVYFTPNIDKTPLIELYNKYFSNIPKENIEPPVGNTSTPEPTPEPVAEPPVQNNNTSPEEQINEVPLTPEVPEITEPQPPVFSWISTSSFLSDQGKFSYKPENTTDGLLNTAWLEGVKGNGIGEWIMYSAENEQTLSSITLFNGYLKNNTTYISNGRIKKLSVEFSDGTIIPYDIPKATYAESKNGIKFTLNEPVKTTSVKITILDVYTGTYYTDTAISGINFE